MDIGCFTSAEAQLFREVGVCDFTSRLASMNEMILGNLTDMISFSTTQFRHEREKEV